MIDVLKSQDFRRSDWKRICSGRTCCNTTSTPQPARPSTGDCPQGSPRFYYFRLPRSPPLH